jgi:hypothetical protein
MCKFCAIILICAKRTDPKSQYTNNDRHIAIYEIENITNQYGFITDFHMFSDVEINIKIEIEEANINNLYTDLKNYMTLSDYEVCHSKSNKECTILLNITFLKSTGDLRNDVPAVPG